MTRLRGKGIGTLREGRTVTSEEIRRVKREVLTAIRTGPATGLAKNLVMVTSGLPGEGKTFVSLALGMSIAQEPDHRVLVVDGDLLRPRVDRELGFEASRGLVDLLLDADLDVGDVLLPSDVDGFSVIPAGVPHDLTADLVASKRMTSLLTELAERYDDRIVVVDSPPLLVSTEATAMVPYMGQILLVVAAEETPRSSVAAAVDLLSDHPGVKIVMNKARSLIGAPPSYGHYYYAKR